MVLERTFSIIKPDGKTESDWRDLLRGLKKLVLP